MKRYDASIDDWLSIYTNLKFSIRALYFVEMYDIFLSWSSTSLPLLAVCWLPLPSSSSYSLFFLALFLSCTEWISYSWLNISIDWTQFKMDAKLHIKNEIHREIRCESFAYQNISHFSFYAMAWWVPRACVRWEILNLHFDLMGTWEILESLTGQQQQQEHWHAKRKKSLKQTMNHM